MILVCVKVFAKIYTLAGLTDARHSGIVPRREHSTCGNRHSLHAMSGL